MISCKMRYHADFYDIIHPPHLRWAPRRPAPRSARGAGGPGRPRRAGGSGVTPAQKPCRVCVWAAVCAPPLAPLPPCGLSLGALLGCRLARGPRRSGLQFIADPGVARGRAHTRDQRAESGGGGKCKCKMQINRSNRECLLSSTHTHTVSQSAHSRGESRPRVARGDGARASGGLRRESETTTVGSARGTNLSKALRF